MKDVWVTVWEHKYGHDLCVFDSLEKAEKHRQEIAEEYWDDAEISDFINEEIPEDREKMADLYFEVMGERGVEAFHIHKTFVR